MLDSLPLMEPPVNLDAAGVGAVDPATTPGRRVVLDRAVHDDGAAFGAVDRPTLAT